MADVLSFQARVSGAGNISLGPKFFTYNSDHADTPLAGVVTIQAGTTVQILGGTAPVLGYVAAASFVALFPAGSIRVATQEADMALYGEPIGAGGAKVLAGAEITELRIQAPGASDVSVSVFLGGS